MFMNIRFRLSKIDLDHHFVVPNGNIMTKFYTVSARITPDMSRNIKKYKINVSETIRKALDEEIKRRKAAEIEAGLEGMKDSLDTISMGDIVRMIREDREPR